MGEGGTDRRGGSLSGKPWYRNLPKVSVQVECSNTVHRISWRAGKLVLRDHDLEAERALVALGSDPCYCIGLFEAWEQGQNSPFEALEILLSEDLDWSLEFQPRLAKFRWALQAGGGPLVAQVYQKELTHHVLFSAPFELRKMFGLSTVVAAAKSWDEDAHFRAEWGPVFEGVLARRAIAALQENVEGWNPRLAPHAITTLECWAVRSTEAPTIAGSIATSGGFALLNLPLTWLVDVWAAGIAVVDDCFVLDLVDVNRDLSSMNVIAARWERNLGRSVPVTSPACVTRSSGGGFHLSWGDW